MIKKKAFACLLMNLAKLISWAMLALLLIAGCIRTGQKISYTINELPPNPGTIFININYPQRFIEFELFNGRLIRTNEGKSFTYKEEGRKYWQEESDFFKTAYRNNRWYEKEQKLTSMLSQYDLQGLEELYLRFDRNKGKMESDKYFLTGPSRIPQRYFHYGYSSILVPNRQFSYVIYKGTFLIDISTREITFPFGHGGGGFEWSLDGRYVAYRTDSTIRGKVRSLVVKDICESRTVFEQHIDRYIGDITWSPDCRNVAILTNREKISLLPIFITGRPWPYVNFYLEIYDMSGKELYKNRVIDNVRWGGGKIVWLPHGRQ